MTAFDPLTMIEADLDWVVGKNGDMIETNSTVRDYVVTLDDDLLVYPYGGDETIAIRSCVDEEHAMWIAEAFEREALRSIVRGHDYRGRPVNSDTN